MRAGHCLLCGEGTEPMARGSLALRRCRACSFIALDAGSNPTAYFHEVEGEFFGTGYLRRQDWFGRWLRVRKARRRLALVRRFKPSGRLLDIGCGQGELLLAARAIGYQAEGLEFSPALAEHARAATGLPVHHGDASQLDVAGPYDVVVMSHVLEHTVDPVAVLSGVAGTLAPGGVLLLAVPNVGSWDALLAGWGSWEPYHLWYFSPVTLRRALDQAGYEVLFARTYEPVSAWFNTLLRTALPRQHAAFRRAIHHDETGRLRAVRTVVMAILNAARVLSGTGLIPLRKLQEWNDKGEELVLVGRAVT